MLRSYVKLAWKVLRRRPLFTAVSLFGVAVTLVVLMVATATLDQIFGARAPETKLRRTLGVQFAVVKSEHWTRNGAAGYRLLTEAALPMREQPWVEEVSLSTMPEGVVTYVRGERISMSLKRTDGAFWRAMEFRFLEGGPFTEADDREGRAVAVVNATTKKRLFGEGAAVGKEVDIDGRLYRVVGVVPDVPFLRFVPFADVWAPISSLPDGAWKKELVGNFMAVIVAKRRADLPKVRAEFDERRARVAVEKPFTQLDASAETLFESFSRFFFASDGGGSRAGRLAAALSVGALLFMLLPAVNLVNLNVSRILERAAEIGVRKAFGASSSHLVLQFVVENVVLCLLGGGIGLVLSLGALDVVERTGFIPYADFRLNLRVFLAGAGLALFFGLLSGVYPAFRMARLHPVEALKGRSR